MKRFIECLVPTIACNIKCSYCYVIQENRRGKGRANFLYSPEYIADALSSERLGGQSLISITASGETMLSKEVPEIIAAILKKGHCVNVTTNGTFKNRFIELIELVGSDIDRLHISFSFHYVELKRVGLVETFFENIRICKDAGASILVQVNLSDEYVPVWEEIKELVKVNCGANPQVVLTRDESTIPFKIMTKLTDEEYIRIGEEMKSPLFEFTVDNFNKKQNNFCYAGDWSAKLNLATGEMTGCYGQGIHQNIYDDINKPIKFKPVGSCAFQYCFNSSHFLSLGTIPSIDTLSYGQLRNRKEANWYSKTMKSFLNEKLYDSNEEYTLIQRKMIGLETKFRKVLKLPQKVISKLVK